MNAFVLGPAGRPLARDATSRSQLRSSTVVIAYAQRCPCRVPISSRMRNEGGFNSPPQIPLQPKDKQRAIELLGCLTQRKNPTQSTKQEIEDLVGALPPSREVAQQWKGILQSRREARRKHRENPTAYSNRKRILAEVSLPERNRHLSRCFTLLGCLQRRYRLSEIPSARVTKELTVKLGNYPKNEEDTHHYIKTLVHLQKLRSSKELRPPRIPDGSLEELYAASMLLGSFAVKGSIGRQESRLVSLIGALPRTTNIAASWKKIVEAAIRKKIRRDASKLRRKEIERKRLERRLRRQAQELEGGCLPESQLPSSLSSSRDHSSQTSSKPRIAKDEDKAAKSEKQWRAPACVRRLRRFFADVFKS